ncbi:hypothetical protein HIM_01929 [Hirsutella minnesotensis 3608]|nr:hypothetical protein HIM_01929 [Hirsutella minnesotensis 3608]
MVHSYELYDDVAWDRGEAIFESIREKLFDQDLYYEIARFVTKHRKGGSPMTFFPPQRGGFNFFYRIQYADMQSVIIRFPLPGFFRIAQEKLLAEVAAIRYIADHTSVPVPFILHFGTADESPGGLGPFIIMEYIEHSCDLVDLLKTPPSSPTDREKLEYVYGQIADIMLQLAKCEFHRIGSLGLPSPPYGLEDTGEPQVTSRPLSYNMALLGEVGGIPYFELPSKTFATSSEYYSALADMHLQQLSFQRNQAIASPEDCRKKYLARQLFRKVAAEHRIGLLETNHGPFKLWCDDFRPANILVNNEFRVVGVVDWEFTYAAPAEFSFSPPWWLLSIMPEEWPDGLDSWSNAYQERLEFFLQVFQAKERELIQSGRLKDSQTLSLRMRQNWETGDFWLTYAARKSWAFDAIFWRSLDRRFFGHDDTDGENSESINRVKLLTDRQASIMESFVQRKIREKPEEILIDWYAPDARSLLPPDVLAEADVRSDRLWSPESSGI